MLHKMKKYLVAGSFFFHLGKFIGSIPRRIRKFIGRVRRKCDFCIGIVVRWLLYHKGSVQSNKLFVMTFDNRFSCNPRYIVSEILKQQLPIDIVWVIPSKAPFYREDFPPGIRLVQHGSYSMYLEMATARVWLDNALNCVWDYMPKKKSQIYINTWHGSMGIKKLSGNQVWLHRAKRCNKVTDFCISNSVFEEGVYHGTFWKDVPCLKFGHARNDIFFNEEQMKQIKQKVYKHFEIAESEKLFLYAPTFRDDGKMETFDLDFTQLKWALEQRFGGIWNILVRMHFKNRKMDSLVFYHEWLKSAAQYGDMQELMAAADAGMTDYSSWVYDYVLTRRPIFIYAPDIEWYDQTRGFYYPLSATPFPVAQSTADLKTAILAFDNGTYIEGVEHFLSDKECYENGYASERIVEFIKSIMNTVTT